MVDLVKVARSGDRVETLRALRDVLAAGIAECGSGRDLAALSRQLQQVLAELDALGASAPKGGTTLDEVAARRRARKASAAGESDAPGEVVPGR